jgi:hypothetical protein
MVSGQFSPEAFCCSGMNDAPATLKTTVPLSTAFVNGRD